MKIFVTGGTGFIGKHVVHGLAARKHELLLLVRDLKKGKAAFSGMRNISFLKGDLSDANRFKNTLIRFKPDAAIHMAAEGIPDYGSAMSIRNLQFGLDLLRLLGEVGCKKVLVTGSCWEYDVPNAYAAAKNALHALGEWVAKEHGMNLIWTRLFFVYGPGQKAASLIPHLIRKAANHEVPELKTPDIKQDFIYVGDVADAIIRLISGQSLSGTYDIGSGKLIAVKKVAGLVLKNFGMKYIAPRGKGGRISNGRAANGKAITKAIGWKAKTTLSEGIKKYINTLR